MNLAPHYYSKAKGILEYTFLLPFQCSSTTKILTVDHVPVDSYSHDLGFALDNLINAVAKETSLSLHNFLWPKESLTLSKLLASGLATCSSCLLRTHSLPTFLPCSCYLFALMELQFLDHLHSNCLMEEEDSHDKIQISRPYQVRILGKGDPWISIFIKQPRRSLCTLILEIMASDKTAPRQLQIIP